MLISVGDTLFNIMLALNLEPHVEQQDKNKKPSEWKGIMVMQRLAVFVNDYLNCCN